MAVVQKRRPSTRAKNQKAAPIESGKAKGVVRPRAWVRDTCSVLFFAAGIFLLLGLGSHVYQLGAGVVPTAEGNSMGAAGHAVGRILFDGLGAVALVPVGALVWLAFFRLGGDSSRQRLYPPIIAVFAFGLLVVSLATVLAIVGGPVFGRPSLGGSVGNSTLFFSLRGLGTGGVAVLMGVLALISSAIILQRSIGEVAAALRIVAQAVLVVCTVKIPLLLSRFVFIGLGFIWSCVQNGIYLLSKLFVMREPVDVEERIAGGSKARGRRISGDPEPSDTAKGFELGAPSEVTTSVEPSEKNEPIIVKPKPRDSSAPKSLRSASDSKSKTEGETLQSGATPQFEEYQAPELSLLTREDNQQHGEDDDELRLKAEQIEAKLRDFNIAGRVTQVHPGPVITLFEFEPAAGVKVGRIAALQDDLAMSLRASSIRIIAPLPKRGTVGIEVPNKHRATVRLRDCLESQAFDSADSILSVPLGKDTYGDAVVVDIATMPHLLMAGATGTGKSVCINALLLSLLYRAHPSELGLILIDPKVLELSIYDGIPHLRVPVVTDPRQAKGVLSWAVKEMDRRYRYMQKFGVRNIDGYNRVVAGKPPIDAEEPPVSASAVQMQMFGDKPAETTEGDLEADKNVVESIAPEQLKPLPKLVIVIDELADLMLSVGREIEELITRLAQKARAAGIHLIVATQRPSVDVITGLIKANFPARLSFRVSSRIDSRTILDSMGAEKLLGKGDMLFMLPGAVPLKRVHGAFVADPEVQKVVAALKANCSPQYDEAIIAACDKAMSESSGEDGGSNSGEPGGEDDFDPFYDKAVELVVEKGQASTSMIQRTFRIGYNRAARIIEMMEREGVVGKMDGVRPREVIAPPVRSTGS